MNWSPPTTQVLAAFRVAGDVVPTHTPNVWRVRAVTLKRVDHQAAVEWVSELLTGPRPCPHRHRPRTRRRPTQGPCAIGPDHAGNLLEIIWLELSEDVDLVIHAMPSARPAPAN